MEEFYIMSTNTVTAPSEKLLDLIEAELRSIGLLEP